jgi:lipopolysaccharide/colanic/teichoic acid biosynthesis glycosyltransferase
MRTFGLIIKRLLDLVGAIILLLLFAPIFFVVAVAIKLDSPGPVFFRQERIGCRGRGFRIFKFRTMTADADRLTRGLPGDSASPLITSVGRHLRNYRIDELPQLLNVVRGEMSLVGPRPLVPLYAHTWTQEERKRLNMRPGMTGWQQINGAGTLNWEQRAALDVWYVKHWSFWLDCLILLRTPWVVVRGNTVYGKDGQDRSAIPTQASQTMETADAAATTKNN